ncbi:bromodomain and WD repeat-containing protein isoform X2 [Arctopsyche grandis]|uniref:bromodomain and WD repeat-containing protein isoform X2 n=1 Tax=Arctopsyche grandis TaxID=121162 RepID=UPI00406D9DED
MEPPGGAAADSRSAAAAELYFLVAKLLSSGPLQAAGQALRDELTRSKVLPTRLDWLGRPHDQTFEGLEWQYSSVANDHLLSLCEAFIKCPPDKPKQSLLCSSLFRKRLPKKKNNVLDILLSRSIGHHKAGGGPLRLPAIFYGSLQLQRKTLGHLSAVYCVLFDRSGRYIITGADDLLVKIWSAVDGRLLGTLRGAASEITDIAVDTDNLLVAAGSLDRHVRVWDMQTAAPIAVLQGHSGMITSVHFCPGHSGDLSCLVSTSTDGSVAFWTYSQADDGKPSFISKPVQYIERMRPGSCQMICAAWSPGGAFLAAGSADHHVRVYMMSESGPRRILETAVHSDAVDSIQWAHTGLRFVSGSKDGSAIMWQLHAMQWRHTKLNMTDTLVGEFVDPEDSKKIKVTMVGWDCLDNYIITAVSDYSLKVWCSLTGKLVRVLRGHTDEIYVLEAHPSHPDVLLSAGHDGQIRIWDIMKGVTLNSFSNDIDGQGHAAVFDAKWCPDGTKVAATDSHGHILMLGLGKGHPLFQILPRELFFHTDYRPLMWDNLGGVCDEQTGIPPHLMSPPFLVDVEGNPHPPYLQRLVPGREHASLDQLVPDNSGNVLLHDTPHSHVSFMIALAMRQIVLNNNDGQAQPHGSNESADRLHNLMPRSVDYPSRDGGRSSDAAHLPESSRSAETSRSAENSLPGESSHSNDEQRHYERRLGEANRDEDGDDVNRDWQQGDLVLRGGRPLITPLRAPILAARRLNIEELTQMEMSWYAREMRRRPLMISTSVGNANERKRPSRRGRTRGGPRRKAEPVGQQEYDEPPEVASPQQTDSDSSVRISLSDNSGFNSSQSDNTDDDSSNSSSSEYSDWVADQPGVPLEPPKRSKRKPARQTQPQAVKKKVEENGVLPKVDEIPEPYRPSEWLCAVLPRKAPYHPQMGDECMYFKQGHARYLEAVTEKNIYKVSSRDKPWERVDLMECEAVKVIGIKYVIRPPRLVCLKLALDRGGSFTVRYHDMPDVLDFFVLRQMYELAIERKWKTDDKFRCMIDDGWWMGTIVEGGDTRSDSSSDDDDNANEKNHFLSLRVRWDNGEFEQMSPWDLEPIEESRLPQEVGGWVAVLPEELENLLYRPRFEDWPGGDRDEACSMIARGIDQVMELAIAEPFVAPVDLNVYPTYAYIVEYPIDLSTIKARFENHFYRRVTSAQFDVRYLATNAEKFNLPHTSIVKQARVITELCLEIIRYPMEVDVQSFYHNLMDSYNSSDSDVPLSKQTSSKTRGHRGGVNGWFSRCRSVLKGIIAASDSYPFREPVSVNLLPEYQQIVKHPMDLSTVKKRLEGGVYRSPMEFAKDMRLIFSNSKLYNTNKKSQIYAMTLRLASLFEALFSPIRGNWMDSKRKGSSAVQGSDDSASDFEDYRPPNGYNNTLNTYSRTRRVVDYNTDDASSSNDQVVANNGDAASQHDDYNSSDSDVPLREAPVYKGKGKGKRSANMNNHTSSQKATRSSKRSRSKANGEKDTSLEDNSYEVNGRADKNNTTSDGDSDDSRQNDDDSGDSYKPTKRANGNADLFYRNRSSKRQPKKKKDKRKRTAKKSHRRSKAKKRKINSAAGEDDSSSNTSASVASQGAGRYESDRSFQLRADSDDDSDDDRPLGTMRRTDQSFQTNQNNFTASRLRQRQTLPSDDESQAGPSGYSNRVRRTVRESKRPKYNEDSEEDMDSIAAISKRSRAHQNSRVNALFLRSRVTLSTYRQGMGTIVQNGSGPSTSHHSPERDSSSSQASVQSPTEAFAPEDDEPLSVSSRGRIRKLTAKAKYLLRD